MRQQAASKDGESASGESAFTVAVRTLCEFTAKLGDLELRFTPTPTAQEGIEGHTIIAARRAAHFATAHPETAPYEKAPYEKAPYEKEVALESTHCGLRIKGRADGYDTQANQLEEFKTYRGELARMPENQRALHWAQVRVYGALICRMRNVSSIRLALVYFDVVRQTETVLSEEWAAADLDTFLDGLCQKFLQWAQQEAAHRAVRDAALSALTFPLGDFRPGQRELAQAVYRCVRNGASLLAQAPTGSGKTIGTLFPALKAMPAAKLDKAFCLSAKTPGRRLSMEALARIQSGMPAGSLRVVELVAREKACEFPANECQGTSCPLARGFYDRLPAARREAVEASLLDQATLRRIALAHNICPYYLGQELARWSDVVVGDYNYYFDLTAALYAFTVSYEWRICLLVDEAHNLLERARRMYSVLLKRDAFTQAKREAPPALKGMLTRITNVWNTLAMESEQDTYRVCNEVDEDLLGALGRCIDAVIEYQSLEPQPLPDAVLDFFFEAMRFRRLADGFDSTSLFELTHAASPTAEKPRIDLGLRSVIPRRFLAPRFAAARASILFSATLTPHEFVRDTLGMPADTRWIDVPSPFRAEQLTVRCVRSISTRYRDRDRSLGPLARLIHRAYVETPGNYIAYFSSFEYLNGVVARLTAEHPDIPVWHQTPGMSEAARSGFLQRFVEGGRGIGFAVLGGAFAEGIDLPGSRLVGAFIATLGLPQVNASNEEIARRMQATFGSGFEYGYLYPGLQKVVQAAGRVIRTPTDRGSLYLIDDRYGRADVRKLLPTWWSEVSAAPP